MYKTKIKSLSDLIPIIEQHKTQGKKNVFTNGCFDILHVGHVRYLNNAKKLGDILIVAINTDNSVKRIKDEKRPILNETDRSEIIAALEFVDFVILFDEDTPYNVISKIKPDILVKGGDYKNDVVVGQDIVEANGGEVCIENLEQGKSTTDIIDVILRKYGNL